MKMRNQIRLDTEFVKAQIGVLLNNYPELTDDTEALSLSLSSETNLEQVVTELVRLERSAVSFANAIDDEVDRLRSRSYRYEQQQAAFRAMIQNLLELAGQSKLTLPIATVSLASGRPGCVITDEAVLPEEFIRTKREPEKAKITAALILGERVPGAELRNSQPHLMIRV